MAGHSMGGGILLQHSIENYQEKIIGIILFAPLLGHNSPAFPQDQTVKKDTTEPFKKINITKIVGLKILNEIGNHNYDSLPVLFFRMKDGTSILKYSY